jgi:hypothetical protein
MNSISGSRFSEVRFLFNFSIESVRRRSAFRLESSIYKLPPFCAIFLKNTAIYIIRNLESSRIIPYIQF